jgi:TetR/AcrR family transcriptional regulator, transcriptional repressor for nem operon
MMNVMFAIMMIIMYMSSHGGSMKVSKVKMAENRALILNAAARLFRERGFDGVTVSEVMSAAGLTHGAFYGHFESKEDLIACALETAVHDMAAHTADSIGAYASDYLSKEHRDAAAGCAYATLGSEVARSTPEARGVLTDGLKKLIATLEEKAPGRSAEARRQKAVTAWATMVGALLLSRVVDDEALSSEILERAKQDLAG